METPMKGYLTLRCSICKNINFRSVNTAENHALKIHGDGVGIVTEWVGLPATTYSGGYALPKEKQR